MTRDIDIIIEITLTEVDEFVKLFASDCYIDKESVKQATLNDGMFNIIHNDSVVKADFIIRKMISMEKKNFQEDKNWILKEYPYLLLLPKISCYPSYYGAKIHNPISSFAMSGK